MKMLDSNKVCENVNSPNIVIEKLLKITVIRSKLLISSQNTMQICCILIRLTKYLPSHLIHNDSTVTISIIIE
jgi:hypothetical protein